MAKHSSGKMMPEYFKQILHTQLFSVLNIFFGFATLFILIKYMKIVEYGEYVLIQGFIALSGLILSQNIYSYARLHIPGAESVKQYAYLKTVISIVFIGYFVVIILAKILNLGNYIWDFFEIDSSFGYLLLIMLSFELINLEFMRFFIAIKKIYLKNYAQFFQKVFVFIGIVILLSLDILSLTNFLYLFIAGQLLVFISFVSAINIKQLVKSNFMIDVFQKGYHVALPLLPIGLMSISLNYTDTLMISKFIDKEHVAQYGFASQIVAIVMMLIGTSIVLTLFPYATEAHNKNDRVLRTEFFLKMFKFGSALALLFYILSNINAHWLISLSGLKNYSDVPLYLSILAIFPFLQLLYSVSSHHLQLMKVFKIQVFFAIIVMLENVVLNYFMIQSYGVMGAAYASLLSFLTLSILYFLTSCRHDHELLKSIKQSLHYIELIVIFGFLLFLYIIFSNQVFFTNKFFVVFGNILVIFSTGVYIIHAKFKKRRFI